MLNPVNLTLNEATKEIIPKRIHGLDTLRACAIILVYLCHYAFVVNRGVLDVGEVGVDLFFVLSGYLIGNQIFKELICSVKFSTKTFMIRRLMRTLPNYLVVVILYFFGSRLW